MSTRTIELDLLGSHPTLSQEFDDGSGSECSEVRNSDSDATVGMQDRLARETLIPSHDDMSGSPTPKTAAEATGVEADPAAAECNTKKARDDWPQGPAVKPKVNREIFRSWKVEIIACILMLIAVAAIAVTIAPHQGKPLPRWPFRISTNTLLAIYATVIKTAMILVSGSCISQHQWSWFSRGRPLIDFARFADVSQGSILGAFAWLASHHIRQPLVALGAIIIVFAMAIEVFTQQITSYIDCDDSMGYTGMFASLPRTNYLSYAMLANNYNFTSGKPYLTLLNVLSGSLPMNDFPTGCITGNCSFSLPFSTVGICHTCEDISSLVKVEKYCTQTSKTADNATLVQEIDCPKFEDIGVNMNYTVTSSLPSGLNSTWWASVSWERTSLSTEILTLPFRHSYFLASRESTELFNNVNSINLTDSDGWTSTASIDFLVPSTIFTETGIDPSTGLSLTGCDGGLDNQHAWSCQGYGAARCYMKPCGRTYRASISAGLLQQELVSQGGANWNWSSQSLGYVPQVGNATYPNIAIIDPVMGMLDLQCANSDELSRLRDSGVATDTSSGWIQFNPWPPPNSMLANTSLPNPAETPTLDSPFPLSLWEHGCLYLIDLLSYETFLQTISLALSEDSVADYFNEGVLFVKNESDYNYGLAALTEMRDYIFNPSTAYPTGIQLLYNLSTVNFASINSTFSSMANVFTDVARQYGHPNHSAPALGSINHYATCLDAAWGWVAFPACLVLLTIVLLVLTIIQHDHAGKTTPVWKSNALAMIFHGPGDPWLYGASREHVTELNSTEGMEKIAKKVRVKLQNEKGELIKLVKLDDSYSE